jgi:sugar lactone lactonase YvrE
VFESNANSGTVVRMDIKNGTVAATDTIATGFSPNTGVPGSILGASGLTYNPAGDILYVVDGVNNRLVAFTGATNIPPDGITVTATGFSGPSSSQARVVYSGNPINAPVSAALLVNGNVIVGNTADNNMVEISPSGRLLATRNVDTGATGAIFGIVTTGTTAVNQKIYFNDDNTNTVVLISQ